MKRLALILVLLLLGTAVIANNAERLLLYHFDPTRVSPAEAGEPRLREVTQNGLVLWVADPAPGHPTILYFHGNAGNLALRTGRFGKFLDRGYGLAAMAYPGSSGSTGEQSTDAFDAHARAVYDTLSGPVVIYGESLGTGVAVTLAARTAPVALVLEAPFTSIRDMARVMYPQLGDLVDRLPNLWPSETQIAASTAPLLILHGARDALIPVDMARDMRTASGARDKTLFVVKGAGHQNVWQPAAQRVLYHFLDRF
ncbi:alpha/beta hydrolase [Aliiroseovarius subalbicans]|uniref:alpha/beta hydrolase n=1 Tax=Aliiroseovarius subalbicans TaxID=2925840 RepID=UPI001F56F6BB|nr:alpha/beta hydrolase [Aliiroseovarius subalbicans]MCI2400759.1 alpha/beta hydrolase [Aliiroseovarius subalbicans]